MSLFGNAVLRFALSLYVLDQTGSSSVFGMILAISMIPIRGSAFWRHFGRPRKHRVDYGGAGLYYSPLRSESLEFWFQAGGITVVAVLMFVLMIIQSFTSLPYKPSVPLLAQGRKSCPEPMAWSFRSMRLQICNGPIIGGFLYGFFGLWPIT